MLVSNVKSQHTELKTIPSVQLQVKTESGQYEIAVLAMDFGDAVTRLILEAMYVASLNGYTEEESVELCLTTLPKIENDERELVLVLHEIRQRRWANQQRELMLNISDENLDKLLIQLEAQGSLSFTVGHELPNSRFVNSLDEINMELLSSIYEDSLDSALSKISNNEEFVIACGRKFYPEDVFINRGFLRLDYMNHLSGGAYYLFETLRYAYDTDEHFKANPDFFSRTHCECGGELVIRKNEWNEYTLMSCINPFCFEKMSFCLADFARAMGIDGLGATTLLELTKGVAFTNCYHTGDVQCDYTTLLLRENAEYLGESAGQLWNDFLDAIEKFDGTPKDLIIAMGLPYMAEDAAKILTAEVLQDEKMEPNTLMQIANTMGKRDVKFILNLWLYFKDFRYVVLGLAKNINLNLMEEYFIYITKSILLELDDGTIQKMTKAKFVDMVNRSLVDAGVTNVRVSLKSSVTYECKALIADVDRGTGSCATAQAYGVPIYTSREFLQTLGGA